jgi:hypothetical protein
MEGWHSPSSGTLTLGFLSMDEITPVAAIPNFGLV